jgi:hypothetical protein
MTSLLSTLFGISLLATVSAGGEVPSDAWVPLAGDRVIVDTRENVGYLVRENGDFTSFPVLTGQRRVVRYIGRTYNAATPEKKWTVKSVDVKGRSMTFGETGTFMRLYDEDGQTAYGIHSHLTFQKMLDEGDRYRSMGCVLVSEDMLKLILKTYELNGNTLDVVTTFGGVELPDAKPDVSRKPGWLGL